MAKFHRLNVPSFDLTWLSLTEHEQVALIAGGGGSFKSGVKNQIQIARVHDADKVTFLESYITDEDTKRRLCCGLACGVIGENRVVVALLDTDCLILALEVNEDGTIRFARKADFQVDFAKEESSVNCCVVTRKGYVVTGGQDGVGRVWKVDSSNAAEWKVTLSSELKGHSGPIMALSDHPEENWVCSAAKDGTCKVWDVTHTGKINLPAAKKSESDTPAEGEASAPDVSREAIADVPCCVDGIAGSGSAAAGAKTAMQCRGCSFSADGDFMFSIQSGKKGATHLIKWALQKGKTALKVVPDKVALVTGVPCTLLRMDASGEYLAVGASDGAVTVFATKQLSRVTTYAAHDLPVTGMGFAPPILAHNLGMKTVITSCSADRKFCVMKVGGYSGLFKTLVVLLLALLCLVLYMYSASLYVLLADNNLLRPM